MTNQEIKVLHTIETIQSGINGIAENFRENEQLTPQMKFLLDCVIKIVDELKDELKELK